MRMNPITLIFAMLVVIYMFWVVLGGTPADRMHRSCVPVALLGTITGSLVGAASESAGQRTEDAFDSGYEACVNMVWRLLYEDKDIEKRREQYYE